MPIFGGDEQSQRNRETGELVLRARRGDAAAFTELARTFLRPAYSVALAIVARPADAEDVAQDAFVSALERLDTCREPERFAGWLLQIVRNRALNWLERRKLRDVAPNENAIDDRWVAPRGEEASLGRELSAALAELPVGQREVVLLHDLEDWTHAEIGAALGISEVMSRQQLFLARKTLRRSLDEPAAALATPNRPVSRPAIAKVEHE